MLCDVYAFADNKDIKCGIPTPKTAPRDLVPNSVALAQTIQGQSSAEHLKLLFNSGSTNTFINSVKV
jgi:hypothetical protein